MIAKNITILELLNRYPETIPVFQAYDRKLSTCICCTSMFETVEKTALKHRIDLKKFLYELHRALRK